jgi:hypothetical protein
VLEKLDYEVCKDMLVKPLPDEYIEKEIVKPVDTGMKDTDGYTMSDTETVKETVLTTFKKGIVLRIPSNYTWMDANNHPEVGDIVAYPRKSAIDFDLFKDSQLVNPYNIVAFIKKQN